MNDFCNTVTEAQMKLYADMRRGSDPRWDLMPVEDHLSPPFYDRRRLISWTAIALVILGACYVGVGFEVARHDDAPSGRTVAEGGINGQ